MFQLRPIPACRIVQACGGMIEMESHVGTGSIFTALLPVFDRFVEEKKKRNRSAELEGIYSSSMMNRPCERWQRASLNG